MLERSATFLVYIVDDDDSVRAALSRLMAASGIRAKAFATPEAFLCEATEASEGCVLLDLNMPRMTGLQVQEKLKEMSVRQPVIAVSARDGQEVREMARSLGARFFLHKPVDDQALLDAIAWVTDGTENSKGEQIGPRTVRSRGSHVPIGNGSPVRFASEQPAATPKTGFDSIEEESP